MEELRKGGYEASLITTFNAYLPFYEDVVLRRLMNAGMRHNVLVMDANQYSDALQTHPPKFAGRQYTLAPLAMPGAFHPKLIFLTGKKKGLIIVGSHNMTLSGFGFNRELTNVVKIEGGQDLAGISIAASAWQALIDWIDASRKPLPAQILEMIHKFQDFAPWLDLNANTPPGNVTLLAGVPGKPALWDQLKAQITSEVTAVSLAGAFFDSRLSFIKRLQSELAPEKLNVAVDPETVQMPVKEMDIPGINFVRANQLGATSDSENTSAGYLHAKGLYFKSEQGESIFVSGSANPSTPAWLDEQGSGNAELMLLRRGEDTDQLALDLGFTEIESMPQLLGEDRLKIAETWDSRSSDSQTTRRSGMAVVEDGQIFIDVGEMAPISKPTITLIGVDDLEIAQVTDIPLKPGKGISSFSPEQLSKGMLIRLSEGTYQPIDCLLHHAGLVAEQSRTGVQRRFKEALLSLETDTPDIALLIDCIDKIVFSDSKSGQQGQSRFKVRSGEDPETEDSGPSTLAINVEDTKKKLTKKRLDYAGDFGFLLDALLYHLRVQGDKTVESLDLRGRNEEEQVDSDDDDEGTTLPPQKRLELLDLCHAKVRLVVTRMIHQFQAYSDGKLTLDDVLVRLLGVLAVMRELRRCDGRVVWIDKGKTTVPAKERLRLFEETLFTLFEGESSLLRLEAMGDDFKHSDDVARLKGLLVWLAWDCGLSIDYHAGFMESPEKQDTRLKRNAMMLALAQSIESDSVVIDEARQSIGSLSTSELDWLKGLQQLMLQCDSVKLGDPSITWAENTDAKPGDIAVHTKLKNWDLRIVSANAGSQITLINLNRKKETKAFTSDVLTFARLS
jgi:hypothetical protein